MRAACFSYLTTATSWRLCLIDFLSALSNRVLELTPEGVHQYGGGYTEYVARTGHEAPGLRS